MKNCCLLLLKLAILILVLTSCATQMPTSEGLIFTEGKTPDIGKSSFGDNISGEMTEGITYLVPFKKLEHAAADKFGENSLNKLDDSFLFSIPIPSFSVAYSDRIALGSTVPFFGFWQMDGTVRIFGQYYLTFNRKILFKNTEIIFQRRLWYKNNGGFSLGAFYRHDPLQLKEEDSSVTGNRFYISWFGVRSVFQTPDQGGIGLHLRGHVNAGYIPEFKTPLITVGFSVPLRFGNKKKSRSLVPWF